MGKFWRAAFPEIPLLGEEGDTGDPNAEYRWVVDPIDGTVNYAFGIPHAAVSIALQQRDEKMPVECLKMSERLPGEASERKGRSHITLLGVIYGPFTDELWTATRGGPTRLNGRIVRVSQPREIGRGHHCDGIFQEQTI